MKAVVLSCVGQRLLLPNARHLRESGGPEEKSKFTIGLGFAHNSVKQEHHFGASFQGVYFTYLTDPGRCLGLSCGAPSGQSTERADREAAIVIAAIRLSAGIAHNPEKQIGFWEMGISDDDTAWNPRYFRFLCKKTARFASACSNHISHTVGLIWPPFRGGNGSLVQIIVAVHTTRRKSPSPSNIYGKNALVSKKEFTVLLWKQMTPRRMGRGRWRGLQEMRPNRAQYLRSIARPHRPLPRRPG